MSAISIDIYESKISVKELLAMLTQHEEVILTDKNKQIAKLTSLIPQAVQNVNCKERRQGGLSTSITWISPDFDDPLEDFAEYMP
jgi:antitoxin (DNA-binding transcriptional repressor) of toxin-antitoxin stability system